MVKLQNFEMSHTSLPLPKIYAKLEQKDACSLIKELQNLKNFYNTKCFIRCSTVRQSSAYATAYIAKYWLRGHVYEDILIHRQELRFKINRIETGFCQSTLKT